jgi:hypothetical protein
VNPEIRQPWDKNPKSEARNPKEIPMTKIPSPKSDGRAFAERYQFSDFGFGAWNLIRISDFGLRIYSCRFLWSKDAL